MSEQKHDRIFLQHCDGSYCGFDKTWCEWRINEDDVEYIRADLVEQQLAEREKQNVLLREALVQVGEYQTCYRKSDCIDGGKYGKGVFEDDLNNAMGGKPWQNCSCLPCAYFEALAATDDLSGLVLCDAEPVLHVSEQGGRLGYCITSPGPLYKARKT